MHCPYCRNTDTRVLDSRVADDGGSIRRRRICTPDNGGCGKRFTTVELMQLTVVKRSGASEPFTRDKAISGVRKACKGRPVTEDQLARLGQRVEAARFEVTVDRGDAPLGRGVGAVQQRQHLEVVRRCVSKPLERGLICLRSQIGLRCRRCAHHLTAPLLCGTNTIEASVSAGSAMSFTCRTM